MSARRIFWDGDEGSPSAREMSSKMSRFMRSGDPRGAACIHSGPRTRACRTTESALAVAQRILLSSVVTLGACARS